MKIRLNVSAGKYNEVKALLEQHDIEINDEADLVLTERNSFIDVLSVKQSNSNDIVMLPVKDIIFIETFGHSVVVHTNTQDYFANDRLYKICGLLDPDCFLRISNSVVIAKNKVQSITPSLFMKFILTMTNGAKVDVTRGYYYIFKDEFKI